MRLVMTAALVLGLSACSDMPDRDEVQSALKLVPFGVPEARLRGMHNSDDEEQVEKDIAAFEQAVVDCMYENTEIEGVNWEAVDNITGILHEIHEDNREELEKADSGRTHRKVMDKGMRAYFGGEKPSESEQERIQEGMSGFREWTRASQDCVEERTSELQQRLF